MRRPARRVRWGTPGPPPAVERSPSGDAERGAGSARPRHLSTVPAEDAADGEVTAWTHGLTPFTNQARPRGPSLPIQFSKYCVKVLFILVTVFWRSLDLVPKARPRLPRPVPILAATDPPPPTGGDRPGAVVARGVQATWPRAPPSPPRVSELYALYTAACSALTATVLTTQRRTPSL